MFVCVCVLGRGGTPAREIIIVSFAIRVIYSYVFYSNRFDDFVVSKVRPKSYLAGCLKLSTKNNSAVSRTVLIAADVPIIAAVGPYVKYR